MICKNVFSFSVSFHCLYVSYLFIFFLFLFWNLDFCFFFIDFALSWPLMKLSIKLAIKRTRCGDSNDKLSDWVGWGRAAMG